MSCICRVRNSAQESWFYRAKTPAVRLDVKSSILLDRFPKTLREYVRNAMDRLVPVDARTRQSEERLIRFGRVSVGNLFLNHGVHCDVQVRIHTINDHFAIRKLLGSLKVLCILWMLLHCFEERSILTSSFLVC